MLWLDGDLSPREGGLQEATVEGVSTTMIYAGYPVWCRMVRVGNNQHNTALITECQLILNQVR